MVEVEGGMVEVEGGQKRPEAGVKLRAARPGPLASRRSLVVVEEALVGPHLLHHLASSSLSDEHILRSVAASCPPGRLPGVLEALSLELGPDQGDLTLRTTTCLTDLAAAMVEDLREEGEAVVRDILNELVESVVERGEASRAVERYTHFYHPLAGRRDVEGMSEALHSTQATLGDGAARLQAAYSIILVEAGRQVAVSYRRILVEQMARLERGEQEEVVGRDTVAALLAVTRQVVELTVEYLKAATRDVVDSSVEEVRHILARMGEGREVEGDGGDGGREGGEGGG